VRNQKVNIAVVGATGMVGQEMLRVLEDRDFPVDQLFVFASERSEGEILTFNDKDYRIEALKPEAFEGKSIDFALFATDAAISAEYAPRAAAAGAIVIDNSSHFRMQKDIPLIVPEVNPDEISKAAQHGIIANPNCSTIQMVVCLKALNDSVPIKRVVVSTYQSVSGAGQDAMNELQTQVGELFAGRDVNARIFPHRIAFNCIPHIDVFLENGMTKEEMKMINETRKILNLPNLLITATAVRVPVFIGHCESLNVEFNSAFSSDEAREVLHNTPGVIVMDEPGSRLYPTAFDSAGQDEILVGRIRRDESVSFGLHLWIAADNIRKGAATNAVQIAELCLEKNFSRVAA